MSSENEEESKRESIDPRIEEQKKNLRIAFTVLSWWLLLGFVVILIYAVKGPVKFDFFRAVSTFTNGSLIACASVSLGVILGFLFGIPRTLQDNPSGGSDLTYGQKVNTNLEQISDWLTKIIVGVGLTQLAQIPGKLEAMAGYFGPAVGDNGSFALALILNFSTTGFVMGYILTRLFLAKAFYVADSSTASDFRRFKDEVKAETQKTSETVKAAQDTIKAVAYRVTKEIMEDPLTADRRSDPATKQIMQAASQKILQEPEENRSIDDWLIAAYEALQNGEYREAIKRAEKALAANPPPESLWRIHNLLGLSYHYLQPDNWEKGQPEEWFQKSREYYQLAIKEANSEGERLLSRANLAFLYLDTGRYEECENEVNSILATANEIEHGSAVYDLVRLVAAALKAVQGQPEQSAKYLNEVKDLPRWKYLFEGKDISTDIVKKLVKIEGIKPEYRDFLNQYLKD